MIRPPLSHRSAPQVDHPIDETWITKKAPLKRLARPNFSPRRIVQRFVSS